MKTLIRKLAVIAASFTASAAMATVIDFESPDAGGLHEWSTVLSPTQGFDFGQGAFMEIFDTAEGPWTTLGAPHSGHFVVANIGGGSMVMKPVGGGTFTLNDLWIRNWSPNDDGFPGSGIAGYRNGVAVGVVQFRITAGWEQIVTNFADVDMVILAPAAGQAFQLDDVTVNAPVPEPTSVVLMGAGLLGLAAVRRARKR